MIRWLNYIMVFLFSPVLFAQSLQHSSSFAQNNNVNCLACPQAGDFYIGVQAGASFSKDADIDVITGPDPFADWDPAPEGYNSDLGNSGILGASVGYAITPLFATEIEVTHRGSFEYEKAQSGPYPKTRHFDLSNTSAMANVIVNGSGFSTPLATRMGMIVFDPFVKVGAGVAFNTVEDFHAVLNDNSGTASGIMADNTESSFAYQLGAGFNIRTPYSFVLGIGYRYFDGGDFESNDYFTSGNQAVIEPWEGELKANEVYASLSYVL